MKYRTLGSTGLTTSVIGIGTWQFGGEWGKSFDQPEVDAMFDKARDTGINLIDTAECYGDHLSEQHVGAAIEKDRQRWIVATKFGHKFHGLLDRSEPRRPEDVRQQLEDSLRALRTDYIDLYQYHSWGDDQFFNDDVLAVLHEARDAGKVRHIGNSVGKNTNEAQVEASQRMGIEAIQIIYNRLDTKPADTRVFDICRQQNLGVLARVPMASGFLSGKYDLDAKFDPGEVRGKRDPEQIRATIEKVQQIQKNEVPEGVPMAQWALAWCLQHDAMTCVIPGCKSVEQVASNAAAADLDMVADDHPQAAPQPAGV